MGGRLGCSQHQYEEDAEKRVGLLADDKINQSPQDEGSGQLQRSDYHVPEDCYAEFPPVSREDGPVQLVFLVTRSVLVPLELQTMLLLAHVVGRVDHSQLFDLHLVILGLLEEWLDPREKESGKTASLL